MSPTDGLAGSTPSRDFAALADALPDVVIRFDEELRYLFVNRAAEALFGRRRDDLVGASLGSFGLPTELSDRYREHVTRALSTGEPSVFDIVTPSSLGARSYEVRVVAEPAEEGRARTALFIARDVTERIHAESVLRESERQFRTIADETPTFLWLSDRDRPNTFINRRLAEFLGVETTALGPGWSESIHPDDVAAVTDEFASAAREQRDFEAEFRIRRHDGAWRWMRDVGRPRFSSSGEFLGYAGSLTDVTDRRDAEQQLRFLAEAGRLLGTSLDLDELLDAVTSLGVPALGDVCLIDLVVDGRHTRRVGAATLTAESRALADEFVRVSRPLAEGAVLRRVLDTGKPVLIARVTETERAEISARNPAVATAIAGVRSTLTVPLVARGEMLGALAFAVLESDRVLGERELTLATLLAERAAVAIQNARHFAATRDAEALMRGFFNAPGVATCIIEIEPAANGEPDDVIFAVPNDAFAGAYGMTPAELAGHSACELGIPPDRVAAFAGALRRSHDARTSMTIEIQPYLSRPPIWRLGNINPIASTANGRPRFAYIATDITERKQLEVQFLQAQKMEAVGRLAGGVAHDFNNLLTVIGGCADFLLDSIPPTDPAHGDALEVKRTAERAAGLTRQLLTFSSRQVVHPRDIDVNHLVREAEKLLRRLIGEDVALRTSLTQQPAIVHIDAGQLEQALVNLVVNARDAMPRGGELTIATSTLAPMALGTDEHPTGDWVSIAVMDAGTGMDDATQARIFEPFFTTKGPGKGTGLGLATVFGIVKQAGGRVTVRSAPGKGSTFTMFLPLASGAALTPSPGLPLPPATGTERILLVEDDARVRHLARRALELHGYEVLDAETGREALAAAARAPGPIHLVLTDVVLPGLSGRELAEAVRATHPDARFLFMSGYTEDALVHHRVAELGAPFLEKPFAVAELVRAVRDALDARR
jgi:two-component system cell cycle sensor histidine kinase/response regulator CckA